MGRLLNYRARCAFMCVMCGVLVVVSAPTINLSGGQDKGAGKQQADQQAAKKKADEKARNAAQAAKNRKPNTDKQQFTSTAAKAKNNKTTRANTGSRAWKMTAENENTALEFVRKNHAELEELLIYLKENRKTQYERAIRDLYRAHQRLTLIKQRDPKRHRLELRAWKLDSRIEVLAARIAMQDSEPLRKQLRQAVEQHVQVKIALLKDDKAKAAERLRKVNTQLQKYQQSQEAEVDRQINLLTRETKRRQPNRRRANDRSNQADKSDSPSKSGSATKSKKPNDK